MLVQKRHLYPSCILLISSFDNSKPEDELIKLLFDAKCDDLQKTLSKSNKERRFFHLCKYALHSRKCNLSTVLFIQNKFNFKSCKILCRIIASNTYIAYLNLSNNEINDEGLSYLCSGLKVNSTLVSIDLSSNQILENGANNLFHTLLYHPSITSIDLSNKIHNFKNIIGNNGCIELKRLLKENYIFSIINLAENEIGGQGLGYICEGLRFNKGLISLDLSRNNLPLNAIYYLRIHK